MIEDKQHRLPEIAHDERNQLEGGDRDDYVLVAANPDADAGNGIEDVANFRQLDVHRKMPSESEFNPEERSSSACVIRRQVGSALYEPVVCQESDERGAVETG